MITLTVDDDPTVLREMAELLKQIDPKGTHMQASDGTSALTLARERRTEVVFLDIELPDVDGLTVAERLAEQLPRTDIVFITGYEKYAVRAFALYASGYLLKPITEPRLRLSLDNLRHSAPAGTGRRLTARCFGYFELYWQEKPLSFPRKRAKEVFAYLIDRQGALCPTGEIAAALWGNALTARQSLRAVVACLRSVLREIGMEDVPIREHRQLGLRRELIDCDYWRWLEGDRKKPYQGQYLLSCDWAEPTRNWLREQEQP